MILVQVLIGLAVAFGLYQFIIRNYDATAKFEDRFTKIRNSNFAPSIKKTFSEDLSNKREGFERIL